MLPLSVVDCRLSVGNSARGPKAAVVRTENCWSSWDCGDASDTTDEVRLNEGQCKAAVLGSPVAAKFAHALRMLAASVFWLASSGAANGAFGWSNRSTTCR